MRYKKVNISKRKKTKSPFIIPLTNYILAEIMLIMIICVIMIFLPHKISDFIGYLGIIIIFGGMAVFYIIVGYKSRKR